MTCKNNSTKLVSNKPEVDGIPYIYEEAQEDGTTTHYIANIIDTVLVGYKYFDFQGVTRMDLVIRGTAKGVLKIYQSDKHSMSYQKDHLEIGPKDILAGEVSMDVEGNDWMQVSVPVDMRDGEYGLFFYYKGEGAFALKSFEIY